MPYRFIIADRETHNSAEKTYGGRPIQLLAVQKNRRVDRKGKDSFIFLVGRDIYYNHDMRHNWFIPMARDKAGMRKYYSLFCSDVPTPEQTEWLTRYDYTLV